MAKTKKNATEGLNGALAGTIRGELAARGLTRDQLSELSGVPIDSLKNYLSTSPTRARVMDIDVVDSLARALGIPMQQLIAVAQQRLETNHIVSIHGAGAGGSDNMTILSAEENRRIQADIVTTNYDLVLESAGAAGEQLAGLDDELEGLDPQVREHILRAREELAAAQAEAQRATS